MKVYVMFVGRFCEKGPLGSVISTKAEGCVEKSACER